MKRASRTRRLRDSLRLFAFRLLASDNFGFFAVGGSFFGNFDDNLRRALDNERFRIDKNLNAFGRDDIGDFDLLVETEIVDDDVDVFGRGGRFRFNFNFVQVLLNNAAVFESSRFAAKHDRDGKLNMLVLADAGKVNVQNPVAPCVPLDVFDKGAFGNVAAENDKTAAVAQSGFKAIRSDGKVYDFLFVTVKDGGSLSALAESTVSAFADTFTAFDRQR